MAHDTCDFGAARWRRAVPFRAIRRTYRSLPGEDGSWSRHNRRGAS
ncbi:hypothetical protein Rrhod_1734 [Rhodococcus rhodnii LMG 5362]|uniref:Uncharacterized protein n=1 Tax=Rhodococcus rhodnii LMG 5362 TaxID=1273125 RepID=R7WND7_9NOCA|nr:hypothetical protein Rrhod_1734 [Rhodococcus rhodnii LMG 5362]